MKSSLIIKYSLNSHGVLIMFVVSDFFLINMLFRKQFKEKQLVIKSAAAFDHVWTTSSSIVWILFAVSGFLVSSNCHQFYQLSLLLVQHVIEPTESETPIGLWYLIHWRNSLVVVVVFLFLFLFSGRDLKVLYDL